MQVESWTSVPDAHALCLLWGWPGLRLYYPLPGLTVLLEFGSAACPFVSVQRASAELFLSPSKPAPRRSPQHRGVGKLITPQTSSTRALVPSSPMSTPANADRLQLQARLRDVLPSAEAARITWAIRSEKLVHKLVHEHKHARQTTAELLTFIRGKLDSGPAAAAAVRGVQSRGEAPQPTTSSRPAQSTRVSFGSAIESRSESHWPLVAESLVARAAAASLAPVTLRRPFD